MASQSHANDGARMVRECECKVPEYYGHEAYENRVIRCRRCGKVV